jgi:hypothetical protein
MRDELDIPMPRMAPATGPSYRVSRGANPIDPATKRLAVIAGGLGGALLLLVGVWSLGGHHHGGVPVVQADSRPLRSKPDQPGGMQVAGENETILSGASGGKDAMAPPPETPAPETLKAEARQQLAAQTASAAALAAATATPAMTSPMRAEPTVPAPVTSAPATPAVAAVSAPSATPDQKLIAHAAAKAAKPVVPGNTQVQLAALGSEQAAMVEWQRLTHKMPVLLNDRHPAVLRSEFDGKTYFRLRTGGFTNIAEATAFCEQVRAKGVGCALARF